MSARVSVVLLVLAAGVVAGPARGVDRALLVGIDRYQDPRVSWTPGGVADARNLANLAIETFGFSPEDVKVLEDEAATDEAILAGFREWLIEGTRPGDRVFFAYAGHGSQLEDDNGDEDDGWDETIAPYNVNPETGEHQVRDDLLRALTAQLSGRRAVLLFDSCHSGTVTRSAAGVPSRPGARYLPRPDQFREVGAAVVTRGGGSASGYEVAPSGAAGEQTLLDQLNEGGGHYSGIVTISAARPGQLAFPVETEAGPRGALSLVFEDLHRGPSGSRGFFERFGKKAIRTTGGAVGGSLGSLASGGSVDGGQVAGNLAGGLTVAALDTAVGAAVENLQSSGQLEGNQQPWFEVVSERPLWDEPLFGGWDQEAAVAMSNPVGDLDVGLRLVGDRTFFREGELLEFEVSTNRQGWLYLLVFSEGRVATCVYPNAQDVGNRISAGSTVLPTSAAYEFPVQEPFGRDVAVAVVSEHRLSLCEKVGYTWDEIFDLVGLDQAHRLFQLEQMRGVGVRPSGASPSAPQAPGDGAVRSWQSASLTFVTRRN